MSKGICQQNPFSGQFCLHLPPQDKHPHKRGLQADYRYQALDHSMAAPQNMKVREKGEGS